MPRIIYLPVVAVTMVVGLACESTSGPRVCTDIGCSSGLRLTLHGELPDTFTISVNSGGDRPWIVECTPEAPCDNGVFLSDFTPDWIYVTIRGDGLSVEEEIRPSYETHTPNGPDCPPSCMIAEVMLTVS